MKPSEDQVRNALRAYAAELPQTHTPPPASLLWMRAERHNRRRALDRATRPLRIMQIIGFVCALAATAWALHQSRTATLDTTLLRWAAVATLLLAAGCWIMFRLDRRLSVN